MSEGCIMIVEADVLVRSPLAEYLRDCGYHVLETASVEEARELLAERAAEIDIVLADIDADDGSGFALAASIRRNYPDIDIMLAGTVTKTLERAGDLCDESSALNKPYDQQAVADQIRRLLAARDRDRHTD